MISGSYSESVRGMKKVFTLLPKKGQMRRPNLSGIGVLQKNHLWEKEVDISVKDSQTDVAAKLKRLVNPLKIV